MSKSYVPQRSGNLRILRRVPKLRLVQSSLPRVQDLFSFGVAYYPDYIPNVRSMGTHETSGADNSCSREIKEKIFSDLKRMLRCGIKTIRIGEFSWSTVQPSELEWKPDVFLACLDAAERLKLDVIFCTPTATPPKWLIDKHPDILPTLRNGMKIPFGSRRHYDFCHPEYAQYSQKITEKFALEFGRHPAVVGWQTDNEFGCHNSVFQFSLHVRATFQRWLKEKYQNRIDLLNETWFTAFWSQGYTQFEQIELPLSSWSDQNPGLELDFRRFSNEMVVQFQSQQVQILKKNSPGRFITHNLMTLFFDLCPWLISDDLDVVGFDHYQMEQDVHPISSHWQFALMRSLRQRKFLILEQQPLQVNWQPINRRFEPDYLFLWTFQSAALGASSLMCFSWQKMYGGAEQYHDGIVPHDLRVTESWQEKLLKSCHDVFADLEEVFGFANGLPNCNKDVLCIFDSESLWSHEITSQSTDYSTRKQIDSITQWCASLGLGLHFERSILHSQTQLQNFKVLVLPGQAFELSEREQQVLASFVHGGGIVISYPRSAYKKKSNQFTPEPLNFYARHPLVLRDFGALLPTEQACSQRFVGKYWCEQISIPEENKFGEPTQWKVVETFEAKSLYANYPAVLKFSSGSKGGFHLHFATCFESQPELVLFLQTSFESQFDCAVKSQSKAKALRFQTQKQTLQIFPLGNSYACVNFACEEKLVELNKEVFPNGLQQCYFAKAPEKFNANEDFFVQRKLWKAPSPGVLSVRIPARGVCFFR